MAQHYDTLNTAELNSLMLLILPLFLSGDTSSNTIPFNTIPYSPLDETSRADGGGEHHVKVNGL